MAENSDKPRVTLAVPVYNGADYLCEGLEAIRAQEFGDFEVLIWDNASEDSTDEIARDFVASDSRFRYHRNDHNVGGAVNSNLLLAAARGALFKWAYHDDLMDPAAIRRCVEVLDEGGEEVVLAYPRVRLIDARGDFVACHDDAHLVLDSDDVADRVRELLTRFVTQTQFGVMRTEAARRSGGVCVDVAGEMVLPLAMALRGKLRLVPEQLVSIRQHEDRHGGHRESEAAWVNPDRPRSIFPYSRATPLYLKAVLDAPLTARERAASLWAVTRYFTLPSLRTVAGDLVRLPRDAGWIR